MPLVFEEASGADAEAIARLVNSAYRTDAGWTHEADLVAGNRVESAALAAAMAAQNNVVLVARRDGELVGCVQVEQAGDTAHIGLLAVAPKFQGLSIGSRLLTYAEDYASRWFAPARYAVAVLSARTELMSYYGRRGYAETGHRAEYPIAAGVGRPKRNDLTVITMEKRAAGAPPREGPS